MAKVKGSADIASARITGQVATAPSPDIFKEEFAARKELTKSGAAVGALLVASDDLQQGMSAARDAKKTLQDFNAKMEADTTIKGSDYSRLFDAEVERVTALAQSGLEAGGFERFTKLFDTSGMRQTVINSGTIKVAKDGVAVFNGSMTEATEILSNPDTYLTDPTKIQTTLLDMSAIAQTTIDGGFATKADVDKKLRIAKNEGLALAISDTINASLDPELARDKFNKTGKTGNSGIDSILKQLPKKDIEAIEAQVSGFTREEREAQVRAEERDKVIAISQAAVLRTSVQDNISDPRISADPVARAMHIDLMKAKHVKLIGKREMTPADAAAKEKAVILEGTGEAIMRHIASKGKGAHEALTRLVLESDASDPQLSHLYNSRIFANAKDRAELIRNIAAVIGQPDTARLGETKDALLNHFASVKDPQAAADFFVKTGRTGDDTLDAKVTSLRPDERRELVNIVGDGVSELLALRKRKKLENHAEALSDVEEFASDMTEEYVKVQPPILEGQTSKVQIATDAERTAELFADIKGQYDALVDVEVGYTQKDADKAFKEFKKNYTQDAIAEHFNDLSPRELKARMEDFYLKGVTGDTTLNDLFSKLDPDARRDTLAEVEQPVAKRRSIGETRLDENINSLGLTVTLNNVGEKTAEARKMLEAATNNVAKQNSELIKFKEAAGERIINEMSDSGLYKPALNKLLNRKTPLYNMFTSKKRNALKKQLRESIKNQTEETRINATVSQVRQIFDLSARINDPENPLTFEELAAAEASAKAQGADETYLNNFPSLKKQLLERFRMAESDLRDDDAPVEILRRLRLMGSVKQRQTGEVAEFKLEGGKGRTGTDTTVTELRRLQSDVNKMRAEGKITAAFYKSVTEQIMENRLLQVERERDGMGDPDIIQGEPYFELYTQIDNMISHNGGGTGPQNNPLRAQMYDVGSVLMDKLLARGISVKEGATARQIEQERDVVRSAVIKQINSAYVHEITGGNNVLVKAAQNANALRFTNGRVIKLLDASVAGVEALIDVEVLGDSVIAQSFVDEDSDERYVASMLKGTTIRISNFIPVGNK